MGIISRSVVVTDSAAPATTFVAPTTNGAVFTSPGPSGPPGPGGSNSAVASYVTVVGATRDAVDARIETVGDGRYATSAQGSKADSAVQPAALTTALAAKADLSGGKLNVSQLPDLAITDFLGTVATQAAMLALTGQKGDWCVRSDTSTVWIITGSTPSSLGSWTQMAYPTGVTLPSTTALLKGNGSGGAAAATAGTDYVSPGSYFDIRDSFGAVGDGSTDCTTAIANAISAATALALYGATGVVLIPAGKFVTAPIAALPNRVTIRGVGVGVSQLIRKAGTSTTGAFIRNATNARMCQVTDLTVDGNGVGNGTSHGVVLDNSAATDSDVSNNVSQWVDGRHFASNLHIQNTKGTGFIQKGRGTVEGSNIVTWLCDGHGFDLDSDSVYSGLDAGSSGLDGFILRGGGNRFVGCKGWYSGRISTSGSETDGTGYGWHPANGLYSANTFVACEAQDNKRAGFFMKNTGRQVFSGCNADSNNTAGLGHAGVEMVSSYTCRWEGISWDRAANTNHQLAGIRIIGGGQNVAKVTVDGKSNMAQGSVTSDTVLGSSRLELMDDEGGQGWPGATSLAAAADVSQHFAQREQVSAVTYTWTANTGASSLSSPQTVLPNDPRVTLLGCDAAHLISRGASSNLFGAAFKTPDGGGAKPVSSTGTPVSTSAVGLEFWIAPTSTAAVELITYNFGAGRGGWVQIMLNDRKALDVPMTLGTSGQPGRLKITLPSAATPTKVTLIVVGNALGPIYIPTGAIIWATKARHLFALGDSLIQGETVNTADEIGSIPNRVANMLGYRSLWNGGVRGTSFVTTFSGSPNYATRASNDFSGGVDLVLLGSFGNDALQSVAASTSAAALATTITNLRATQANVPLVVWGPYDPLGGGGASGNIATKATTASVTWADYDSAFRSACVTAGVPYIAGYSGNVYDASGALVGALGPWITTANKDLAISSADTAGIHPSDVGVSIIAERMARSLAILGFGA